MSWVKVNYCFIFKPEETWTAISEINSDMARWLREKGFEAEVVDKDEEDKDEYTLIISKTPMIEPPQPPKSVNKQVHDLIQNRDFDGRFKGEQSKR
jgi:hypothetical protein